MSDVVGKHLKQARPRYEQWLNETAERLSEPYKVDVAAQLKLLKQLRLIEATSLSGANLTKENWNIPRDLRPWKETRADLMNLTKNLEAASKILDNFLDVDRTGLWALDLASENFPYGFPNLTVIRELGEIAGLAASFKGRSGNRPHPQWLLEATKLCQQFWREQKQAEPTSYFNEAKNPKRGEIIQSKATRPGNAFSRWFCEIMKAVGNLNESQCATLLGKARKPRTNSGFVRL
jgi:hypothetical protein